MGKSRRASSCRSGAAPIRQRLDVDAARKQAILMSNAVDLARTTRYFGVVEIGVHAHQDADGPRLLGPTPSLQLPVFDQRQAVIARLEAQQRQAERRLAALSINARSEVRVARLQLSASRETVAHYRIELLAAKQAQVEACRSYIEAVRDYWIARAELERVMGGRVGSPITFATGGTP